MATRKLESLIQALAERTRKSSLGWKVGSREDTFVWSGSGASVLIMSRDNDGQSPWLIRLVDESGRVVEDEEISLYENMGQTVSDLYADARAEALDISATIDKLLGDLG